MAPNVTRLLNLSLRSATLGTRFALIFVLAKYLEPSSVGHYGIFTVTIGYCLYLVGLDFHTYVTREILKTGNEQRGRLLRGQIFLSGVLYFSFLPLIILFLNQTSWPNSITLWFLPILILEHFNQELSRILIILSDQLTASILMFIRQGTWVIAICILMPLIPSSRTLPVAIALWACAGVVAATLGFWRVRRLEMGGWHDPIDWDWIKSGIAVSIPLLLATLSLRGIQTIDRYWIESLGGIELVAAYVLFLGIASTLIVFLDAGLFSFTYPELIKLYQKNHLEQAKAKMRNTFFQTIIFSVFFAALSWLSLPYILNWIDNPAYENSIFLYPWLLSAFTINSLAMIPHYALYAQRLDKHIAHSHVTALASFLASTWLISKSNPTLAIPLGINIAFLVILTWKTLAYFHFSKK